MIAQFILSELQKEHQRQQVCSWAGPVDKIEERPRKFNGWTLHLSNMLSKRVVGHDETADSARQRVWLEARESWKALKLEDGEKARCLARYVMCVL